MALLGREDPSALLKVATMPATRMYIFFLWKVLSIEIRGVLGRQISIPLANCRDFQGLRRGRTK